MIPGSANALLLATAAAGGYSIERSVRFNSNDSAYLSRTPASAGNRKTWTWAGWVKRSKLGTEQVVFTAGSSTSGATWAVLRFTTTDQFQFVHNTSNSTDINLLTTQVFRDASAWYHVLLRADVSNATSADRIDIFINGVKVTNFSTETQPATTVNTAINDAQIHNIGREAARSDYYCDLYLADIHFIDGQALDPTSFGEFDDNGIWQPIEYSGSFGTNGFHLPFDDNSTAAALGTDTSGNGNTWTVNNISVAAGAGNDSLVDVPTNGTASSGGDAGGVVRGNYCTWNPLDKNSSLSLSNGNLDASAGASQGVNATFNIPVGSWYWEITVNTVAGANGTLLGMIGAGQTSSVRDVTAEGLRIMARNDGAILKDATTNQTGLSSWSNGDVIGCAYNATSNSIQFYRNGSTYGSAITPTSGTYVPWCGSTSNTASFSANFGQRPFAHTAPSGFKALCTANLGDPLVTKPSEYMDVKLYLGNGTADGVTQTITGLSMSPDLVWIKSRGNAYSHNLYDAVRGVGQALVSNATTSETTTDALTQFTSDGFTVKRVDSGPYYETNANNATYVAWCWDAGDAANPTTNTQGSITSSVRANPSAGFSIVTYTGTGSATTVGHGLGVAPSMIIVKNRSSAVSWGVGHASPGWSVAGNLENTNSFGASSYFNSTAPTSTVFSVGASSNTNGNGNNMVAYCFAPVAGYSSFGSYTGNGSADGPFVFCGFRPRYILRKRTDTSGPSWRVIDAARNTYNLANEILEPNTSDATENNNEIDILSNGFKVRSADTDGNASGGTIIYAAFAESPFQYARAR